MATAALLYAVVVRHPAGVNGDGALIAERIRSGAMVFLRLQYLRLSLFVLLVGVALALVFSLRDALCFIAGAASSATAGSVGMLTATRANVRTAVAARDEGRPAALAVAFFGGSVMGLAVASLGLFGLGLIVLTFANDAVLARLMTAFGMGASSVALFARVGGGIFTKSADVGADLVGKVESNIAEDDRRNPAVIADNVGDNVGDVAGMGADIFESYCGSIIAAVAIAASLSSLEAASLGSRDSLVLFPLGLAALGLLTSIIGIGVVRLLVRHSAESALAAGVLSTTVLFLGAAALALHVLELSMSAWFAVLAGTVAGVAIGVATDVYTGGGPVRKLAQASETGAATVIIRGLSLGMESIVVPVVVLGLAMFISTELAGLYGVALAAVGMLATAGMVMAIDAYGPIADNAGGIAEMAGMGSETRAITDGLDEIGNTTAAIGKGFAIGAAALAALALISAYVQIVSGGDPAFTLDLADPIVLFGLFLGSLLPFLFSALTMNAVGTAAEAIILEVRRQFAEIPGLREGNAEPDSDRCTAIASNAALTRMVAPGIMSLATPVLVGFLLGPRVLGGLLGGAVITGVVLALMMANAGGAWDNAKKYIERGNLGGKGSSAHAAAIVGDTVGDPFKDTSGPSMNILIKVLAIVSLTIAPLLS